MKLLRYLIVMVCSSVNADVVTDGTMGAAQTLTGANVTIPQTLGKTEGSNLFHSFGDFNINTDQTITFTNTSNVNYQNVIFRVTGGNASNIDGTLKSDIKNADFYFINPNGITFGANAHVDVPAAFHVSTADKMDFGKNGGVFYADLSKDSKLSSDAPAAFGFLGTSKANNGLIDFRRTQLTIDELEKSIDVVAGDIEIKKSTKIETGDIRLVAAGTGEKYVPVDGMTKTATGSISVSSSKFYANSVSVNGGAIQFDNSSEIDATSNIAIKANGDLTLQNNSYISANAAFDDKDDAGQVNVESTGAIQILGDAHITANAVSSSGSAGAIKVKAESLKIDGNSGINADTIRSSGHDAGVIDVQVAKSIEILNGGDISVNANGSSPLGRITVIADTLIIDGKGKSTGISLNGSDNDNISKMKITTIGAMELLDGGQIGGIANEGLAGSVDIKVGSLRIDGQDSGISSPASGVGKPGNISVESGGKIEILNKGTISADTWGSGNGGNIKLIANSFKIDGTGAGISSESMGGGSESGQGGNISIESKGLLEIMNHGIISSDAAYGSAGNAGNIDIKANELNMTTGGIISSNNSYGTGNAGNIDINANELKIDGTTGYKTGFVSDSKGLKGNAGNIVVAATNNLDMTNGGVISTNTDGAGSAGNVNVKATTLTLDNATISAKAAKTSTGQTGYVTINATDKLALINQGKLSIENAGKSGDPTRIIPGTLTVNAPQIELDNGIITAATSGNVNAGVVNVNATNSLTETNASQISSATSGSGNAGDVFVSTPVVSIDNATIKATAEKDSTGAAGSVNVNATKSLTANNLASINSSTFGTGKAGDVTVTAANLSLNKQAEISALAGVNSSGQTGDVKVTATDSIHLSNSGKISIENQANLSADAATTIQPSQITVTAPNIDMENSSKITSQSTGNVAAGNIAVNVAHRLNMDHSFITTEANTGDGGKVNVDTGDLIYLKDSGFTTTVSGENGNGGDISTKAETLIMDTAVIQANAKSGNGGNINLALKSLIPSENILVRGGKFVKWNSSPETINVIQAASDKGVSGTITNTAPQLNLSGVLANSGYSNFDNSLISRDYCELGQSSSLARKGKGGLPLRAKNLQVK